MYFNFFIPYIQSTNVNSTKNALKRGKMMKMEVARFMYSAAVEMSTMMDISKSSNKVDSCRKQCANIALDIKNAHSSCLKNEYFSGTLT